MRKDQTQVHHFPAFPNINPNTLRAREAIKRAQQELESKQRAEEDALLMVLTCLSLKIDYNSFFFQ
jgi:hypothetical protein